MERRIEDAVVMDKKTFKSLTSETRTDILKLLKKRNHTLSEISEKLKISKTTAKEHLDVLLEGRLIEQVPSHHKWKYYTLTEDGRKIVGGEGPTRVVILIATAIIGLLLSVYGFVGLASPPFQMLAEDNAILQEAPEAIGEADTRTFEPESGGMVGIEKEYAEMDAEVMSEAPPPGEAEVIGAEEPVEVPRYDYIAFAVIGISIFAVALYILIKTKRKRGVI